MKTPNDLSVRDVTVSCLPPEFDDMGGGAPGIQVEGFIYNVQELDKVVAMLQKRRTWLKRINDIYGS